MTNKKINSTLPNSSNSNSRKPPFWVFIAIVVALAIVTIVIAVIVLGNNGPVDPTNPAPGLYESATNYANMTMSWEQLIDKKIVYVSDGVLYTNADMSTSTNTSAEQLVGDLVLPTDGSVTQIGEIGLIAKELRAAFAFCDQLTSVVVSDDVTSIGSYAFYKCSAMTNISIPSSVSQIGDNAFGSCSKLIKVGLLGRVTTIPAYAFADSGLTSIGQEGSGADLEISSGLTDICMNAFAGCVKLERVDLTSDLVTIHSGAFMTCTKLASVKLPDSLVSIGDRAFAVCNSLTSVGPVGSGSDLEIPDGITVIKDLTFSNCKGLKTVIIPESVVSIDYAAFKSCASLENFSIHSNVTGIGRAIFKNSKNLAKIEFDGTKSQWQSISKDNEWDKYSVITNVICSDGTIQLP